MQRDDKWPPALKILLQLYSRKVENAMTQLRFEHLNLLCGNLAEPSHVPDVIEQDILQNKLNFDLGEYDEIYEGYGQRRSAYPYRQQDLYSRQLSPKAVEAIILENDYARAEFLPGFGGRLWRLYDKVHKRDLLYTNDCLRASNLAIRNAWFSGGVEWNCGIIGHHPFTMDRIFAAKLEKDGTPILRMYTYERVRRITYQMDFWLEETSPALNCHMCLTNPNEEVTPMYWWSNIASPLYPDGRVLVPAHKAYTYSSGTIIKVAIPHPEEGVDASRYGTIPTSRDYFFENDPDTGHWIANVDASGWGLLHSSSPRLQSRKLFVWGKKTGSQHWQEFLTQNAGEYLEIQAGLGKTQYGCIPMAPHTSWEWTERYAPVQLSDEQRTMDFDAATTSLDTQVQADPAILRAEAFGHEILHLPAQVLFRGTGDGALENAVRAKRGQPPLRSHLDFSSEDSTPKVWRDFLESGVLTPPEENEFPAYDPYGSFWLETLRHCKHKNWYTWYCISLLEKEAGRTDLGLRAIQRSIRMNPTAVGYYVRAVYEMEAGKPRQAGKTICQGLALCHNDLSYVRAAVQLLFRCRCWQLLLEETDKLPQAIQANSRIRLCRAYAQLETGHLEAAQALFTEDGGLELEDVREGEANLSQLWRLLQEKLGHPEAPIPYQFNFDAL